MWALCAKTMKLSMGQMQSASFDGIDRGHGRRDVASNTQIAAMHMERMSQTERLNSMRQRLQNLAWRD